MAQHIFTYTVKQSVTKSQPNIIYQNLEELP